MPIGSDDVRLSGKTGSDQPTVKAALLAHQRHQACVFRDAKNRKLL